MEYREQIKHPLWQKKRLEVLAANNFSCEICGDTESQLNVHHTYYRRGAMIWEYGLGDLQCLCDNCHQDAHKIDDLFKNHILHLAGIHGHKMKYRILGYIDGLMADITYPNHKFVDEEQYQEGFMEGLGNSPFQTFSEAYAYLRGDSK